MTTGLPLLDAIASAKARDEGMKRVAANNAEWISLALLQIEQFARGQHEWSNLEHGFIGEDLRTMLVPRIGNPTSPHCYGTLIRLSVKYGLIEETGQLRAMKSVTSHARRSMVYRWGTRWASR